MIKLKSLGWESDLGLNGWVLNETTSVLLRLTEGDLKGKRDETKESENAVIQPQAKEPCSHQEQRYQERALLLSIWKETSCLHLDSSSLILTGGFWPPEL